ncbi:30S ribosomal protein S13 [bacterium]|nr:30S ribosomal protein S13 [bacterium]|tara:strand:+ start:1132 stop:1521 length:390 start_codon:yes stop_codon:yes gene_type:complete
MARIAGITLPKEKRLPVALTYIHGIGRSASEKIIDQANIKASTRVKDLSEAETGRLREIIEKNFTVEGERKREVLLNVKRLKEISSFRGSRHAHHLPARGQRTKTNTRTVRGNVRRTMGSGRKGSAQKT